MGYSIQKKVFFSTIFVVFLMFLCFLPVFSAQAETTSTSFKILTESEEGDYIGQGESWNFSSSNNAVLDIGSAASDKIQFDAESFNIPWMNFDFAAADGETLSLGLYNPAKRFAFRGSYNGIDVSGDGRGCNEILGAFYVHEYETDSSGLIKAAIDFVQICQPQTSDIYESERPKLFGSIRYNSNVADSCNQDGCAVAKEVLGFEESTLIEISNISVSNITNNSAKISWDTNYNSNTWISYGKTTNSDNWNWIEQDNQSSVKNHSVSINYLDPDTKYYFEVSSRDESQENSSSSKKEGSFTTKSDGFDEQEKPDLVIKDVYTKSGNLKIKYCNGESADTIQTENIAFQDTFYIEVGMNGKTHTGTSDNTNYVLSVPKEGYCKIYSDLPLNYFDVSEGQYTVKTHIDEKDEVSETNENNNTFSKTINIESEEGQEKPDLEIQDIDYSKRNTTIGGTDYLAINFIIKYLNNSSVEINQPFYVSVKTPADNNYANGYMASNYVSESIPANSSESKISGSYLLPPEDFTRDFELQVTAGVDKVFEAVNNPSWIENDNKISESNENNNTLSKTIKIEKTSTLEKPDLTVKDINFDSTNNLQGETGTLSVTVKNLGADLTSSKGLLNWYNNFSDQNFIFDDSTPGITSFESDREMPTESNPLGNYETITFKWKGEFDTSGKLYLQFTVDNADELDETNEDNNTLSKTIEVKNSNSEDGGEMKLGDGTYELKEGDRVKLDNGAIVEPVYFKSGSGSSEFSNVKFNVYSGATKLGTTDATRSGWDAKEFSFQFSEIYDKYTFEVYVQGLGINNGEWHSKITFKSVDDVENEEKNTNDQEIEDIQDKVNKLINDKMDSILEEIQSLRDTVKEQQSQLEHLADLTSDLQNLADNMREAINNFVAYGVDQNTKKLGAGERAAVIHSYKKAFGQLPDSEEELTDVVKIANGRWPGHTNKEAEKEAKEKFREIYKRVPDMDNPRDEAAITVMAYGLRQRAENRNLESEKKGIKIFESIYGHAPQNTEEWNIMQAITYSGASRGTDSDGDFLTDEREEELGTDPNNPDTDGDGHKDGIEVANGYDPLVK